MAEGVSGEMSYQKAAHETSLPMESHLLSPNQIYAMAGLSNEAGEVGGVLKKGLRGDYGVSPATNSVFLEKLSGELGDVAWYLAETCTQFGMDLENVLLDNLEKLRNRQSNGTIMGDGDER
jgi:NTP pyrophosphatase (non-canonical NTP hydrolase)